MTCAEDLKTGAARVKTVSDDLMPDVRVIDVDFDFRSTRAARVWFFGILWLVGALLILIPAVALKPRWPVLPALAPYALFVVFFGAVYLRWHWRQKRALAQCAAVGEIGPVEAVRAALRQAGPSEYDIKQMGRALRKAGLQGLVIRAGSKLEPVEAPLDLPFEPQLLDDTLAPLVWLEGHLRATTASRAAEPAPENDASRAWRALRTKTAPFGPLLYIGLGLGFIGAVVESFELRRVTYQACFFAAAIALWLLLPRGGIGRPQHLAVPGGLVWRQGRWRRVDPELHLFTPPASLLCLVCRTLAGQGRWLIAAADETHQTSFAATTCEARFLLRAWRSPLPPPAVEQLSDLR